MRSFVGTQWKKVKTGISVFIMVLCLFVNQGFAQAQKDVDALKSIYESYRNSFTGIHGNNLFYGSTAQEAEAALQKLETVEKDVLPSVQPVLAVFAENYGSSPGDINNKLFDLGIKEGEAGSKFRDLYKGVTNVKKSRQATAEHIVRESKSTLSNVGFFTVEIKVKKMQEVKTLLQIGQKFDPNNKNINEMLGKIDGQISEVAFKIEKDIDEKKWTGNINGFAGPGTPEELAKAAKDYFMNDKEWGKHPERNIEVLKVCVTGPWKVAETNLFGQVTQWRLPIHVCVTETKLKEKNIARVYELSIVTVEGAPGQVKKAAPFDGYWVGNSWMMRLSKL